MFISVWSLAVGSHVKYHKEEKERVVNICITMYHCNTVKCHLDAKVLVFALIYFVICVSFKLLLKFHFLLENISTTGREWNIS